MTKKIEDRYVKLSHEEHILTRPETYIGSVNKDTKDLFIVRNFKDIKEAKIEYDKVEYSPGFLKIYDEILTNASDHSIRTNEVTYIKVNIKDNIISVENDGPGVPVVIHETEKIYIPELIFGNLLTGENYDDNEERFLGGRNGYGAKLTNIYSKQFIVETADGKHSYHQEFNDNMTIINKPTIKKSKKSFTKITYTPDYEKFSMTEIDDVTLSIMVKRIFDIAAYNPMVKVFYNEELIPFKTFKDYMKLFVTKSDEMFYEKINDNWEIGVMQSPNDSFTQMSMVNGISTLVGGTHVNYINNNLVNAIKPQLERGVKGLNIKVNDIKNRLLLFVNCRLPNPTFDTQTKENLTLKLTAALTKDTNISDKFIKTLTKSDIFTDLVELSLMKEKLEAQKELNKTVGKRIRVDKLFDANNAGKIGKSQDCHLFITEGDCLHEDTMICVLRDGEKLDIKIKDVKVNDVVITHESNFNIITSVSKKIQKTVKIKLKNNEILMCSEEHRWFVYDKDTDEFIYVKTKDLIINRHKFILNRNVNIKSFIKINDIIDIVDKKYNKMIYINGEEIMSTNAHRFSVYNTEKCCLEMIECDKLNKDIHYLVDYNKL